jgi:hypothetical protein
MATSRNMTIGEQHKMSQITLRRTISHIGPLQIAILVLAVATALVHLDRGITTNAMMAHPFPHAGVRPAGPPPGSGGLMFSIMRVIPLPILFYLNFAAYIILAGALYLPPLLRYQRIIRWLLIILVIVTIIAWFMITGGRPNLLAFIDKPVEVALLILLFIEDRQASLNKG